MTCYTLQIKRNNFADDNTISAKSKSKEDLLIFLEQESEGTVQWFRRNQMIVNPDKSQSMIMEKKNKVKETRKLQIFEENIDITDTVKLLGLTLDNKLIFDDHISELCKKASLQLNAINRLKRYMAANQLKVIVNSFIYSNFGYCPHVWHFCSCKLSNKIEQIQKAV